MLSCIPLCEAGVWQLRDSERNRGDVICEIVASLCKKGKCVLVGKKTFKNFSVGRRTVSKTASVPKTLWEKWYCTSLQPSRSTAIRAMPREPLVCSMNIPDGPRAYPAQPGKPVA